MAFTAGDRLAIGAIEAALQHARDAEDQRPALVVPLEDLQRDGPFVPIWRQPTNPARTVDWLGRPHRHA